MRSTILPLGVAWVCFLIGADVYGFFSHRFEDVQPKRWDLLDYLTKKDAGGHRFDLGTSLNNAEAVGEGVPHRSLAESYVKAEMLARHKAWRDYLRKVRSYGLGLVSWNPSLDSNKTDSHLYQAIYHLRKLVVPNSGKAGPWASHHLAYSLCRLNNQNSRIYFDSLFRSSGKFAQLNQARLARADCQFGENRFREAAMLYKEVTDDASSKLRAYALFRLGWIQLTPRLDHGVFDGGLRLKGALSYLKEARSLVGQFEDQSKFDLEKQVMDSMSWALSFKPSDLEIERRLRKTNLLGFRSLTFLRKGQRLVRAGKFERGLVSLKRALTKEPESQYALEVMRLLADAYDQIGDTKEFDLSIQKIHDMVGEDSSWWNRHKNNPASAAMRSDVKAWIVKKKQDRSES